MTKMELGTCKKCKKPRIREPWQSHPSDESPWGWMTYCSHCFHLPSFAYDEIGEPPSQEEKEETIRKYRMWI